MDTWYWAPPVSRTMVRARLPLLKIGYCWYPGRVAFIDIGVQAHWIPLSPFEPYYCRYPWGLRTVVIANGPYPRFAASHKFRYQRHTVMGRQDHFYRDKRGTHVSKWRTTNRSGVYSSPVPTNEARPETRSLRTTRENKNEGRIREDIKPEVNPTRVRRKPPEARIEEVPEGEVVGQRRNRDGSEMGSIERSGSQNRSGVTRTDRDSFRKENSTQRNR